MAELPAFPVEPGEEGSGELVAEGEATQDDNAIDPEADQELAAAALVAFLEKAANQISVSGSIILKANVESVLERPVSQEEFQGISYAITSYMNSILTPIFPALVREIEREFAKFGLADED